MNASKQFLSEFDALLQKFGAPGDYGYSTDAGRMLYAFHKLRAAVRAADYVRGIDHPGDRV